MNALPAVWQTEDLCIRDGLLDEAPQFCRVFNACSYVHKWDPTFRKESDQVFIDLVSRSLRRTEPTGELFQMQGLYLRAGGDLAGYFHLHLGAPASEIAIVSMFLLHPRFQKHRFGSQVVAALACRLAEQGCRAIRLRVALKNWPALKFWIGCGFTSIYQYEGETLLAEGTHASLVLEKPLS